MTTYQNIAKPISTGYSNANGQGKEQYDQVDIFYDDPGVFYDGVNMGQYTNVAKPVGTSYINIAKPT